jgi:hypothetical protein
VSSSDSFLCRTGMQVIDELLVKSRRLVSVFKEELIVWFKLALLLP